MSTLEVHYGNVRTVGDDNVRESVKALLEAVSQNLAPTTVSNSGNRDAVVGPSVGECAMALQQAVCQNLAAAISHPETGSLHTLSPSQQSLDLIMAPNLCDSQHEQIGNMIDHGARRVAAEQNADLQDWYLYNLARLGCRSYHMVYIDKSGFHKTDGLRRKGWAPRGVTPVQVSRFHREHQVQLLAAYTQEGILLQRVYQVSTDTAWFEDYIAQLLHHCSRWPEPNSVLIMDNATFHFSEKIDQMCEEAGVKLLYLPPYSPHLNPIEEFFAELKTFMKEVSLEEGHFIERDFQGFVEWCVDKVGARWESAESHFRHANISIEYPPDNNENC
jgi:hypothetical protein